MSARRAVSTTATAQGLVRAIGVMATTQRMKSGWLTAHCSACIPPIEAPITQCSASICSSSVSSRYCECTMSRRQKRGNRMPGCATLLLGELVSPLPIGSTQTTK